MSSVIKALIGGVVLLGIYRGVVNYAGDSGDDAATIALNLLNAAVNAIADLTYRWVPAVFDFVTGSSEPSTTKAAGGAFRW